MPTFFQGTVSRTVHNGGRTGGTASAMLSALVSVVVAIALALGVLAGAVSAGAQTTTGGSTPTPVAPPPPPQSTAVPGGIGATRGSLVVGIESPEADQQLHTDRDFLIVGYALDTRANVNQGVQGSGIDRVEVWLDIPPDAIQLENAELGFSDASAATFGSQFANSGFRLLFHPGDFPPGSHNLYVVAHSAVNGEQVAMVLWTSITTEPSGGRGGPVFGESGSERRRQRRR